MILKFENSAGVKRTIAEVKSEPEALQEINKFLKERNYKSYYTRTITIDPYHTMYDVGSHTEFFHLVTPCVLIEIDYKGCYERFALTPEEFKRLYKDVRPDIPCETEDGNTYTFRPLVHMWYMLTDIGSAEWCNFFTDMSWGLPQSDIDDDNLSFVAEEKFGELLEIWKEFNKGI